MRHVPPGDILTVIDVDQIAQHAGSDNLMEFLIMARVAKYVTYVQLATGFGSCIDDLNAALWGCSDRFLKQNIVSDSQRSNRWFHMHLVLSTDQCPLSFLRCRE
jgi:hypothetical protein